MKEKEWKRKIRTIKSKTVKEEEERKGKEERQKEPTRNNYMDPYGTHVDQKEQKKEKQTRNKPEGKRKS